MAAAPSGGFACRHCGAARQVEGIPCSFCGADGDRTVPSTTQEGGERISLIGTQVQRSSHRLASQLSVEVTGE
eukprot:8224604-Alexandrium_andersonii.AAC.1